jgi:Tfp pilus assembly protein PilV
MIRYRAVPSRRYAALRSEHGFGLIEAIVAATILAILSLGVLAAVDGAARSTGREKARSVATTLAEQDQERMRGMRAVDLSNYTPDPRTVTVGGAQYEITSRADWIRDPTGGTVSCQSDTQQADYLRIRTTVGIKNPGGVQPIKVDSIVTPPIGSFGDNLGTLAVKVTDRDGGPVVGLPVSITGPTNLNDATNAAGCAIFGFIPVGNYNAKLDSAGWVDPGGNQIVSKPTSVTKGTTTTTQLQYDRAGSIVANIVTQYKDPNDNVVKTVPSRAWNLALANPGLTPLGYENFAPVTVPGTTVTATQLFPFASPYGVYTGPCSEENSSSASGGITQQVNRDTISTVTVSQPALWVQVMDGTTPVQNANVMATLVETGTCADVHASKRTNVNGLTTYSSSNTADKLRGYVTRKPTTDIPFDPGLPYGTWTVCVDNGTKRKTDTVDNKTLSAPGTLKTINLNTGTTAGTCSQ